jgi:hypothetical protein
MWSETVEQVRQQHNITSTIRSDQIVTTERHSPMALSAFHENGPGKDRPGLRPEQSEDGSRITELRRKGPGCLETRASRVLGAKGVLP